MNASVKLLLVSLCVIFTTNGLFTCSCPYFVPGPTLVRNAAARSEVIFIGEVIDSSAGTRTFRILRSIKGLKAVDTIVSREFTSCSTLYGPGYYIIYGSLEGNELNTSYCSPNEKLKPLDYNHVTSSSDEEAFRRLLAAGIERHHFHVSYLLDIFKETGKTARLVTIPVKSDWYRSYTVYTSLKLVGIGLLMLLVLLYFVIRKKVVIYVKKFMLRIVAAAAMTTFLSVFFYSELRPVGIGTQLMQQSYGFPKYIYSSVVDTAGNAYVSSSFHLINLTANFVLYLTLYGVLLLTISLWRSKRE